MQVQTRYFANKLYHIGNTLFMRPRKNHETTFFLYQYIYTMLRNIIYCTVYSVHNIVMPIESCDNQTREKCYNINIGS